LVLLLVDVRDTISTFFHERLLAQISVD